MRDSALLGYRDRVMDLVYFRIDRMVHQSDLLRHLKHFLYAGFPVVFGIPIPRGTSDQPIINCRPKYDSYLGGQAILALGFDDNKLSPGRGALLVQNCWGKQWGDKGYGWLPYSYVSHGIATDFWTAYRPCWGKQGGLFSPLRLQQMETPEK